MFKAVKEQDGLGNKQIHYYLTQGDSCTIISTPQKGGEYVANEVTSCVFKLATKNFKMLATPSVFPIQMTRSGDDFVLEITSTISKQIEDGQYFYEIEYTMNDGSVQTPHSWVFDFVKGIEEQ